MADRCSRPPTFGGSSAWRLFPPTQQVVPKLIIQDFVVFENAFWIGGDETQSFAELASIAVSEDGVSWHEFPCGATAPPYGSCAGVQPVFANADDGAIDPLSFEAGGDRFDLADLGLTRARYVRVTDRADLVGMDGVFDLDAIGILNAQCP